MKKKILTAFVILVLLLLTVPAVYAQDASMSIKVTPSVTAAKVGDTVQYTVYATGEGIAGLQFNLSIPEGMTYVAGSAAIPEGLQESLGWYLMDWTEGSKMWTGCDHLADTFEKDTVILTFACTVDAEGEYEIGILGLEAFESGPNYDGFYPELTVGTVTVEAASASVVKPTLTLKAPTLEFKDMISVIAFYTAENTEDVVEMGMITYTENVDAVDINTADHVLPGADYEETSGRYFSGSQGIHAKNLGDTVYLACYAKLTDGTYVYTKLAPYSPIQYATNQLKNATDTELKQLVVSMLNYGAAAQNYFSHNTETLANASLTGEQLALPESYRSDMVASVPAVSAEKQGAFANNQGFSVRKPAVSFEGAFSINYFFTPAYAPVDGITLYYWTEADFTAADVLTVGNATGSIKMTGTGTEQYRGDIEGIAAKDLSQAIYVAAVYSDGTTTWTSGVLGYSIGAYCESLATKGGTMADLAMATAVYGYHAKQYFG